MLSAMALLLVGGAVLSGPVALGCAVAYVALSTLAVLRLALDAMRRALAWLARSARRAGATTGAALRWSLHWTARTVLAPLLVVTGPMLVLWRVGSPPALVLLGWPLAIAVGCAHAARAEIRQALREIAELVSVGDLVLAVVSWEIAAGLLTVGFLRAPSPDRAFFGVVAGVDVTLLAAAALVVAFPPAWSASRMPFTWIATSVMVMAAGLLAALVGALGGAAGPVLVALSVSPIAPAIAAFLNRAHTLVERAAPQQRSAQVAGAPTRSPGARSNPTWTVSSTDVQRTTRYSRTSRAGETPATYSQRMTNHASTVRAIPIARQRRDEVLAGPGRQRVAPGPRSRRRTKS
jgi:hypothetical protein